MNYQEAVKLIWRHSEGTFPDEAATLKEIIRYATMAPSGHNTQCWRFRVGSRSIAIFPDLSRRTPVVDPDDHHLFVSLGCAIENLVQAARASRDPARRGDPWAEANNEHWRLLRGLLESPCHVLVTLRLRPTRAPSWT